MPKESKSLSEIIRASNERARESGKGISDQELKEIYNGEEGYFEPIASSRPLAEEEPVQKSNPAVADQDDKGLLMGISVIAGFVGVAVFAGDWPRSAKYLGIAGFLAGALYMLIIHDALVRQIWWPIIQRILVIAVVIFVLALIGSGQ
jgi:hypothetical protein